MNLIILGDADGVGENRYSVTDGRADHLRQVLGVAPGDTVEVGFVDGPVGSARIEAVEAGRVLLEVVETRKVAPPCPEIDLVCALPRPQTLKKVLFTAAMMGVRSLHLIRANRVEKSYFQSPLLQPENMRSHLIEGLAQGKRTRLPRVEVHGRFRPFFEDYVPSRQGGFPSVRLVADPEAESGLEADASGCDELLVAIGPEGGWVPFELEVMRRAGFRAFRLGPWMLRVEHAVTAVLAQLELVGNLGGGSAA